MIHILYKPNADGSFDFLEVENLDDFEDMKDGRLYRNGDENDLWWEFSYDDVDTFVNCSDEYLRALIAYRDKEL